jgi:hypothetical protein
MKNNDRVDATVFAFSEAFRQVGIAAQRATQALAGLDWSKIAERLEEAQALLEKQREDERWRNDPLELKAKIIDAFALQRIQQTVGDGLRTLADIIDP